MNQKSNKTIKIVILLILSVLVISGIIYYWQFFILQKDTITNQKEINNTNLTEITTVTTNIFNEFGNSTGSSPVFIDEDFKPNPSEEQKKELTTKKFNNFNYKISPIKEILALGSSDFILGCNVVVDAKINKTQIEELSKQIISNILKEKKDAERIQLYFYTNENLVGTPVDLAMVTWVNGELNIEIREK